MGQTTHLRHIADKEFREKMTKALEPAAALLLERDIWRTHWSIDIDGCTFKIKVEGYPRHGTPRWHAREAENKRLAEQFPEIYHGDIDGDSSL